MNLLKKLFSFRKTIFDVKADQDEELSLEKFALLSDDNRIIKAMRYGDTGDSRYYPILKYCILTDPNLNVKFAALKRIHLFKTNPDFINMLVDLKNHINTKNLEPYYSMALSKAGIISLKEFEDRMNSQ